MPESEDWEGDDFDRKKYADYLTNYISGISTPFVLNINSKWGTGKTFFLSKWFSDISKTNLAVFYNAWERDYSSDPLLTLISRLLEDLHGYSKSCDNQETFTRFLKSSGKFLTSLAPIVAKNVVKKYIGEGGIDELAQIGSDDKNTFTELSEKATQEIVNIVNSSKKTEVDIDNFKKELTKKIHNLSKITKKELPLFLFIDELDRCRPNFAIETLERIKHLFDIPEIKFVIATDTEQLSHSVNAVYGIGFDSRKYLRRFFDQEYALPLIDYVKYATMLFNDLPLPSKMAVYSVNILGGGNRVTDANSRIKFLTLPKNCENQNLILIFAFLAKSLGLDLRTKQQCLKQFVSISDNLPFAGKTYDATYFLLLLMLKAQYPSFYEEYKEAILKHDRINICRKFLSENELRLRIESVDMSARDLFEAYAEVSTLSREEFQNTRNDQGNCRSIKYVICNLGYSAIQFDDYFQFIDLACNLE